MVLADGQGTPLGIYVEKGSPSEVKLLEATLENGRIGGRRAKRRRPKRLIADRGYDSNKVIVEVTDRHEIPVATMKPRIRVRHVVVARSIAHEMSLGVLFEVNPPDTEDERLDVPPHFLLEVASGGRLLAGPALGPSALRADSQAKLRIHGPTLSNTIIPDFSRLPLSLTASTLDSRQPRGLVLG